MVAGGTPYLCGDEAKAEGLEGGHGADQQGHDHAAKDSQHRQRRGQRQQAEAGVSRARPAGGFDSGGKGGRFAQADIGQKAAPESRGTGAIHTRPTPRTSQSCKAFVTAAEPYGNILILNGFKEMTRFMPRSGAG